jgi:multidrug efflux pump subunit AcrB
MRLPELALHNGPFSAVIAFLLLGLGLLAYVSMPRSEDPQIEFPITLTTALYPGTNPLDMERLIADPIEDAINELEDIKTIQTEIEDGLVLIRTEFLYGTDADDTYEDVVSAIQSISNTLPDGLVRLTNTKITPTDVNILQIALSSSTATTPEFKIAAEALETRLERIQGVKRVDIKGLPDLEVQVRADWVRLRQRGVSMDELLAVVTRAAGNLPGGYVNTDERRFTVRTSGDYKDLDTLRRTVVRAVNGQLVYVDDLADIYLTEAVPTYRARFQGSPAVFIAVVQRKGSNIFTVMDGIHAELESFRKTLPDHITVELAHDQSLSVAERVNGFFANLWQGLLLVGCSVLIVLGLRASLVIILVIPFSILMSLGWLDMAGLGLEQMSIVGLVIALGLLVDNAIVVIENVERFLRQGHDGVTAAIKGTSQVGWSIVSGTLTTVLAFLPLLMLQNGSGTFIRSMPVTVIFALLASLLIALTITPILSSRILRSGRAAASPGMVLLAMTRFSERVFLPSVRWTLAHPWLVLGLALIVFGSALLLVPKIGISLFPKAEKLMLLVDIETPEGSTFALTQQAAEKVEQHLLASAPVQLVATNIGKANPRVYYNTMDSKQQSNYAQLMLKVEADRYSDVESWLTGQREFFAMFPDARIRFKEFMQGPPMQAPITIRVIGEDIEGLRLAAKDIVDIIANTEGTVNADSPISKHKVDLRVDVNRDKAAIYQVSLDTVDRTVRAGLVGLQAGTLRDDKGEDYPIMVTGRDSAEPQLSQLRDMVVQAETGALVPLEQVANMTMETAIPRFQHYNLERMALVTADVLPGFEAEPLTNAIIAKLEAYPWPDGISYQIGGEQENRKESFAGLAKALLVAVMGIFAVLVMQFGSFRQPLVVFAALPFAAVGAILSLYITGYSFSFTAGVGMTSLVGIVVNNSIILVDYANQLRANGLKVTEAMLEAAQTRLIPIVLTSLTTILGLLPLTLSGSSMWAPMGWVIMGGLAVSTLLTLYVVPVLYRLLEGK